MSIEVVVPPLPESVSEATVLTWKKKPGDWVERDETLLDLETDKVVLEVPAPEAGVLLTIQEAEGAKVKSHTPLAVIDPKAARPASPTQTAPDPKHTAAAAPVVNSTVDAAVDSVGPVLMPAAQKMAADHQLDLHGLSGSGRGGRVLKEDIQTRLDQTPPPAALGTRPQRRVPMSALRQRIAERLLESQHSRAILATFNEANMQPLMAVRAKYKERFEKEHGVKLGVMSFFVKAALAALKKFPVLNAALDGNTIVYHDYYDIGVAVASPRGLVVPILRDVQTLSLADIEKQIASFGERARAGKLTLDELNGGTYTLSNGGLFGSMMSTPIINPPQSAILGMHAIKERAVVEDGQILIRPMMYLAQSYDHRLIDGKEAVLSLGAIKDAIEDPTRLLLEV